jgi:hypothetical protein
MKKLLNLVLLVALVASIGMLARTTFIDSVDAAYLPYSSGLQFSNGVVINSGLTPTTSGLCLVTGTSGATASYTTCPGGGGGFQPWSVVAISGVAVNGAQYAVNTSGVPAASAVQMNLPASSVNATVVFMDYQGTWGTNNFVIASASGVPINGSAAPSTLTMTSPWLRIICDYIDMTVGYRCHL